MGHEINWYQQLEHDDDYWVDTAKLDFAASMERLMNQSSLTKSALAQRLGSSPAHITKVMRGDANLTINTMVKLARAAGGNLHLHVCPQARSVRWFEKIEGGQASAQRTIPAIAKTWKQFAKRPHHGNQVPAAA